MKLGLLRVYLGFTFTVRLLVREGEAVAFRGLHYMCGGRIIVPVTTCEKHRSHRETGVRSHVPFQATARVAGKSA